jgi:hypothetical protein
VPLAEVSRVFLPKCSLNCWLIFAKLESAFQLQEHLKALHFAHTRPSHLKNNVPITKETALILSEPPEGIEKPLWLYELCRLLANKINDVVVAFFNDDPPCSAHTCPEMRASEWQYLCAVHDPPKGCCAIDYCCHTLDWASNILTSSKNFPSRLSLGHSGEAGGGSEQGLRQLTNVMRRLYRIFAHAWFQHRSVFWQVESQTGLYVFFKTVCDQYSLIPESGYTLPPEAEGSETSSAEVIQGGPNTILRNEDAAFRDSSPPSEDNETSIVNLAFSNTRRHRTTPSTSSPFQTVPEEEPEVESSEKPKATEADSVPEEPKMKEAEGGEMKALPLEKEETDEVKEKDEKEETEGKEEMEGKEGKEAKEGKEGKEGEEGGEGEEEKEKEELASTSLRTDEENDVQGASSEHEGQDASSNATAENEAEKSGDNDKTNSS